MNQSPHAFPQRMNDTLPRSKPLTMTTSSLSALAAFRASTAAARKYRTEELVRAAHRDIAATIKAFAVYPSHSDVSEAHLQKASNYFIGFNIALRPYVYTALKRRERQARPPIDQLDQFMDEDGAVCVQHCFYVALSGLHPPKPRYTTSWGAVIEEALTAGLLENVHWGAPVDGGFLCVCRDFLACECLANKPPVVIDPDFLIATIMSIFHGERLLAPDGVTAHGFREFFTPYPNMTGKQGIREIIKAAFVATCE
jgi:hypothetical protein